MKSNFRDYIYDDSEMKVSTCCGAPCSMTEYGICPECKEHCDFENLNLNEAELSAQEIEEL